MADPRKAESAAHSIWARVLWLDERMRGGRHPNYQGLCEAFGISPRCATQTLTFMKIELGLKIVYVKSEGGYRYAEEASDLPRLRPLALTPEKELASLQIATASARSFVDAETAQDLARLSDRLLALCEPAVRERVGTAADEMVFAGPRPLRAPYIDLIRRAIRERETLMIDYLSPKYRNTVTRRIEPHFLMNLGGDWLLVAWDRKREAPRHFALARIQSIPECCNENFERRDALDPAVYLPDVFHSEGGQGSYELVVRFSQVAAQLAFERKWHPSQTGRALPDGCYEMRMRVAGEGDVVRWLLGFGKNAEVLSPERIRRRVAEEAQAMARLYAAPSQ